MYISVGNPIKLSDLISKVKRSPLLGEHTEEILKDVLGYSAKEIGEIKVSGAITPPEKKEKAAEEIETPPRTGAGFLRKISRGDLTMRIVVHGQQAFGKAVLEALLKRGENIVGVYVAPEKPG